jgi:hypothetical protein
VVVLVALFSNTRLRDTFTASPDTTEPLDPIHPGRAPLQVQHRLTGAEVDQLVERYQAGATIRILVGEFKISRCTAMDHLERRGVPRRACVAMLTEPDVAKAHQLYQSGLSLAQVGKHFGVHGETVRRAFKKAGLAVRPRP